MEFFFSIFGCPSLHSNTEEGLVPPQRKAHLLGGGQAIFCSAQDAANEAEFF